ncbi:MAG: biotin transporter BioY [Actinomycetia bacterium]|nr:biotin transporter BioY [Actinomycetes bacterium]
MSAVATERVLADIIPTTRIRNVLLVTAGAGFVGLAGQLSISVPLLSPTAFTLQTIAVLTVAAALGAVRGMAAMTLYAGLALLGLPWLPGGSGAFNLDGQLVASFGFCVGFIPAAGAVGFLSQRGWTRSFVDTALAMVLGSVIVYGFGIVWLQAALGVSWSSAMYSAMSVFLLTDAIKILVVSAFFPFAWRQLAKAGLTQGATAAVPSEPEPSGSDVAYVESNESGSAEVVQSTDDSEPAATVPSPRDSRETATSAEQADSQGLGDDDGVIDLTDEDDKSLAPAADTSSRED